MGLHSIVKKDKTEFTLEELQKKFPKKAKSITEETVQLLNDANNDPTFNGDEFIRAMVDYQSVMIEGSYSMKEYINALKFVAYLATDADNLTEAYKKARANDTFVQERLEAKTDSNEYKELTNAASRYRKTPLVQKLLTQSNMPLYLMFQGTTYQAVAVLSNEMHTAAFSKDRISAAKAILEHVKPPENLQIELEVGPSAEAQSMQSQLSAQLAETVAMQKRMLDAGVDISQVQKLGLKADVLEVEVVENER
jgi:hypothetical protein